MAGDLEPHERKHESSVRQFCSEHMKTLVTLVMIFGTIICIVLIVMVHKWRYESDQLDEITACIDVAVIGAGISGSYAAWRMRHETHARIHLFEMTDTPGGRFHTQRFEEYDDQNLKAELGAMYYFPQRHLLLNRSIHALRLTPEGYYPPNHVPHINYFRGTHLRRTDFKVHRRYFMERHEADMTPVELKRYYSKSHLENIDGDPLAVKYNKYINLYEMGYWNFIEEVGSREAFNFIQDGAQWKSHVSNGNAALLASMDLTKDDKHYTLTEGMDALPDIMAREFNASTHTHTVHYNKQLVCIERELWGEHRYYRLMYQHTKTVDGVTSNVTKSSRICTNKVILAMSPAAMKYIKFLGFEDRGFSHVNLASMIDEMLQPVPVIIAYIMYNQSWWSGTGPKYQDVVTDLPLRHVRYIGTSRLAQPREQRSPRSTEYGHLFMVASADMDDVSYFDTLVKHGVEGVANASCNLTRQALNDVKNQIAQIQGVHVNSIPDPVGVYIKDWRDAPSYAGWHMWRTGVYWEKAARRLQKPFPNDEIYIVGSDVCPGTCQFWAEGALQTVESLLEQYFPTSHRSPLRAKDFYKAEMDIDIASTNDASIYN